MPDPAPAPASTPLFTNAVVQTGVPLAFVLPAAASRPIALVVIPQSAPASMLVVAAAPRELASEGIAAPQPVAAVAPAVRPATVAPRRAPKQERN